MSISCQGPLTSVNVYATVYNMSCEQHHGCDGVECQPPMDGDRLIRMLQAIRDRDNADRKLRADREATYAAARPLLAEIEGQRPRHVCNAEGPCACEPAVTA